MESTLTLALAGMRRSSGLPVVFGGFVEPNADSFAITRTSGSITTALSGLVIRARHGLGGMVLARAKPAAVTDYLSASHISHQYDPAVSAERLRSIVGVPVVVDGSVRAVLYGALRMSTPIGTGVVETLRESARQAAFELAVAEATELRLRDLETAAIMREARQAPTASEWEAVRIAHAELRELSSSVEDPRLRERLDVIVTRLARRSAPASAPRLSEREIDVLALVAVGDTNVGIAARLGIEPETVKGYLRNAMGKLDAHTRVEAVARARAAGVLP